MQTRPFPTYEEAKEAEKEYKEEYGEVYTRPNPNKKEGGYVVIYGNPPWWNKSIGSGCPRAR